jgi:hypothetical protein
MTINPHHPVLNYQLIIDLPDLISLRPIILPSGKINQAVFFDGI